MHQNRKNNVEEPTKEWADRTNREMAKCVLDYIQKALAHFGVPRGTFADDQFDNFMAMYNRRGDMLTALTKEAGVLREQVTALEDMLVTIANWPNPEKHEQMQAMKVWAASVVDPRRVDHLKSLFVDHNGE